MLKPVWNLPNLLTILRVLLLPWAAHWILNPDRALGAGVLLALLGASDWFDGYLARRFRWETPLGAILDPVADKLLLCVAIVYLVARDFHPLSPALATLLLAREFFVSALRMILAKEGASLPVSQSGKWKTTFQFIGMVLLVVGGEQQSTASQWIGTAGGAILWVAVVMSYWSMWAYAQLAYTALKTKWS